MIKLKISKKDMDIMIHICITVLTVKYNILLIYNNASSVFSKQFLNNKDENIFKRKSKNLK